MDLHLGPRHPIEDDAAQMSRNTGGLKLLSCAERLQHEMSPQACIIAKTIDGLLQPQQVVA